MGNPPKGPPLGRAAIGAGAIAVFIKLRRRARLKLP
jgi:hypothetical protein